MFACVRRGIDVESLQCRLLEGARALGLPVGHQQHGTSGDTEDASPVPQSHDQVHAIRDRSRMLQLHPFLRARA